MTALALGLALIVQGPFARAESLLAAGDLRAALDTADRLVQQHPADANALVLLGRIHFVRPVIGRYPALAAFRAAARLAPTDPEPLYWQMKVGFHLGSDEGDVMAREALLRLFALDPDYRDTWRRFGEVYRNPAIWRRAEAALAHHGAHPVALVRRAELLIALGEAARAESVLTLAMTLQPPTAASSLLRAEANFLAGRVAAGFVWHDSALGLADADSTGALWDEVWMIASPEEAARHAATVPGDRRAFFAQFWSRRDPNLVTPENERIPEHFRRLAHVRRYYRLLHPQNAYFRSLKARAMTVMSGRGTLAEQLSIYPDLLPVSGVDRLPTGQGVGVDPRDVGDTTESGGGSQMYAAGVDARGLIYLRHGPPDVLVKGTWDPLRPIGSPGSPLDNEGWVYYMPDGPISIGFRRGTGDVHSFGPAGDIAFFPVTRHQIEGTRRAMQTDRTALPAPLVARGWSAFFKSGALGRTDAYFKAAPGTAAVVLWQATGGGDEAVRASGPGMMVLTVPPGRYDYGFDVDSAGVVGRLRGAFTVPGFSSVDLGLSSLILAPADSFTAREATLEAMPADLVFDAGTALAMYAEVYGLTPDPTGRARYQVRYTFAPVRSLVGRLLRGVTPVAFEFTREVERRERVVEQIVLEAGRVPPGRYRVSLAVTDLRRNVKSESVALEITIR